MNEFIPTTKLRFVQRALPENTTVLEGQVRMMADDMAQALPP